MAANLHLDLYNFEEAAAQQSRYVLTSPRSLEVNLHKIIHSRNFSVFNTQNVVE